MRRMFDVGGRLDAGPIDKGQHQLADWELRADAVNQALRAVGVKSTDEMRRASEDMDPELYWQIGYYERWIVAVEALVIEKGILTQEEIDRKVAELG
ncbi:MAG: nitrile hydratase subunit beta [Chloroflexi bacterium]|nr:nitrile hydratase subunit beta [Chloroflexota bacterium]